MNTSMTPAIINPVEQIDQAFLYIIGISFFLLFVITVMMIIFVIKYRRSRHPVAADIRGHNWLEITWTVIPTLIALSMFYMGWQSYLGLRDVPKNAYPIRVTAEMFAWTFEYPGGKTSDTLIVPVGKPVKVTLQSMDVLHALYIPAFRIKIDAVPNMNTFAWFYPNKTGTFDVLCAEFCGTGHGDMTTKLEVKTQEEFDEWLKSE